MSSSEGHQERVLFGINTYAFLVRSFKKTEIYGDSESGFYKQWFTIGHVETWGWTVYFLDIECASTCMYTVNVRVLSMDSLNSPCQ